MPNEEPTAAPTTTSALRNAVRAFMRARSLMSEHGMRGRVLALVSETIEAEFLDMRELAASPARIAAAPAMTPRPEFDYNLADLPRLDPPEPVNDKPTVREKRNYGGCDVMGVLVRETRTGFTYTDGEGRTRRRK